MTLYDLAWSPIGVPHRATTVRGWSRIVDFPVQLGPGGGCSDEQEIQDEKRNVAHRNGAMAQRWQATREGSTANPAQATTFRSLL